MRGELTTAPFDPTPRDEAALDERLSRPTSAAVDALRRCGGDIIVLGAGGKMGPSLATMAKRAASELGDGRRVVAVSRFSNREVMPRLELAGVQTIAADLSDRRALESLPDTPNVVYMAGQKFGTRELPSLTWAMNTLVPGLVAERFATSRMVAFSTGNVYPLSPAAGSGSREDDSLTPVGEYANSCVGRERVLEHASRTRGTAIAIVRLNYAVDLRYGVLVDIARRVERGEPVDLGMGFVNVIWQGDANAQALACLSHAASPPFVINVTGAEKLSVRELALRFGTMFDRAPRFVGSESPDALLSNTAVAQGLFGPPSVPADTLARWVGEWMTRGGRLLEKPTGFEVRDGAF